MRPARWLLALLLAAGSSAWAASGPARQAGQDTARQTGRPPPTVVLVQDPHAPESERIPVTHLLRALDEAVARGAVAPVQQLGRRIIDFRITVDETTGTRRMSPLPESVREQGLAADVVVCVGFDALLPFVQGPPLPEDCRVYSYAARNLSHLPPDDELFPNLARVRGGVALDVPLSEVVDGVGRVLARPSPMGVILSRRVPEDLVTPALRRARELEFDLKVQWVDDGREVTKAARNLLAEGIRALAFVPDPHGTDSRVGRLAMDEIRLLCIRNGIALMGRFPDDPAGHFGARAEPSRLAQRMVEMIVHDRNGARDEPPGIEPAPEVLMFDNPAAAQRDGIPLLK